MILNLDPNFSPCPDLPQVKFDLFTFSGGESHIRIAPIEPSTQEVTITHRITSFNKLGELLIATDALKRMGITKINVVIPYFPAARQDRVMIAGEPLTVKVYADIINAQNYNRVIVFDPHSEVTPALLNNCEVIDNTDFIKKAISQLPENMLLVSPDGGALKKIYKLASSLKQHEVVECSKSRNVSTGEVTNFQVYSQDLNNRPCLIVDDICDGGGTFLGIAKSLKEKNAGKLYLAVSHGIFSKGLEALSTVFEHIYTTDSFNTNHQAKNLTRLTLNSEILKSATLNN
ncbi:ribose-phosphate diphosphokinase [uncultured Roseivirga sp.]|uniref:ribose-phosphate diphosphokinase n=1 Tax=uncultured Roseivirga sp. TaxID=543088 RepID=UPI0030D96BC2